MITLFHRLASVQEWVAKYRADIRTIVDWSRLCASTVEVDRVWDDRAKNLFFPWAKKGSWMGGAELKRVKLGDLDAIIQAPSVRYGGRRILLDRCHRISQLRPKLLVLDELVLDSKSKNYFADTLFDVMKD